MKKYSLRPESNVRQCLVRIRENVKTTYRLLRNMDAEKNADIYSLFLTTETKRHVDEEFLFDIARTESEAIIFFRKICAMNVTACTLLDAASDHFAEK